MKNSTLSRRKFIKLSTASGMLLAVGCIPGSSRDKLINVSEVAKESLNQYITIDLNGNVTLYNHRPEMGQGTFQSIPMLLAEELEVDIDKVEIKQSEANREKYGSQMVVGSRSIQSEFQNMRKMGAAAREMLVEAAAKEWKLAVKDCKAHNGEVTNLKTGNKLSYGELVKAAIKLPAPEDPVLKDIKDFNIIGKPVHRRDIPLKTNGDATFGIDVSVPGMLYASVERSPVFLGKVLSFDEEEAMKISGVKYIFKTQRNVFGHTREGVAVLADTYWAAEQGRKKLNVKWDEMELDKESSGVILNRYHQAAQREGDVLHSHGSPEALFNSASEEVIEAVYETPYQAHVPMEPMNATVSVSEDEAEFWGSTQNPNGIRSMMAEKLGIPEDKVKINYTFMGGGFGRRSMTDVAEEATDLSKKAGKPVKVIWSREDDQTQGPFRACSLNICKGILDQKGNIQALEHKVVAQEIRNQTGDNNVAGGQLMGGINTEYNIPNIAVRGVLQKHYVPITYWRAVYHSTNPFAHESFIDELAQKAGKDPLLIRLEMMQHHSRFKRVLETVAEKTNWGKAKPANTGRGLAIAERSGAHFAMVVDVARQNGKIRPVKITTALDLGICVNPDTVKAQTEGSIVMGLTAALHGLTIENGRISEQNFDKYPLLKINECPDIETYIVKSDAAPDGAGESGLPTVAPALANAIFDLTGKRIRKLPIDLDALS